MQKSCNSIIASKNIQFEKINCGGVETCKLQCRWATMFKAYPLLCQKHLKLHHTTLINVHHNPSNPYLFI